MLGSVRTGSVRNGSVRTETTSGVTPRNSKSRKTSLARFTVTGVSTQTVAAYPLFFRVANASLKIRQLRLSLETRHDCLHDFWMTETPVDKTVRLVQISMDVLSFYLQVLLHAVLHAALTEFSAHSETDLLKVFSHLFRRSLLLIQLLLLNVHSSSCSVHFGLKGSFLLADCRVARISFQFRPLHSSSKNLP